MNVPFSFYDDFLCGVQREKRTLAGREPELKPSHLIVLLAFDRDEEGELRDAFEPREMPSEDRAIRAARLIAGDHAGVIAWSRLARPDSGDFGQPTVLFQYGDIPEMD